MRTRGSPILGNLHTSIYTYIHIYIYKYYVCIYIYIYPLVNIQKAIENGHRNSGFTQLIPARKWWIFPYLR